MAVSCAGEGTTVLGGKAGSKSSWQQNISAHSHHRHLGHNGGRRFALSGIAFFVTCFGFYALIAAAYTWTVLLPHHRRAEGLSSAALSQGCREDNEGSWSIGVFYGDSPFSLKPIETVNVWSDKSAAWPVANPVLTCASVTDSGVPSNFVADPFLYVQGDSLYMFYETKNPITMKGEIGAAKSIDRGASWKPLGIVLSEAWHLSFPFVFDYHGQIYMMPESNEIGEVRLYRAYNFPMNWKLEKVILKKPLIDSTIIQHGGYYWLFGSDHSNFGAKKNGQLEIWYSHSPLGPWTPHKKNPIYNVVKSFGARNGGRSFWHEGNLYRVGQDCGQTYGKRTRVFKIEEISKEDYREVEVPFSIDIADQKGINSWNGVRHHHLDVQKLNSGGYIALMDGDRVISGDLGYRILLGYAYLVAAALIIVVLGFLLGVVTCIVPLNWCVNHYHNYARKRNDVLNSDRADFFYGKFGRICSSLNKFPSFIRGIVNPNSTMGRSTIGLVIVIGAFFTCLGFGYIYGGNGISEAYPINGHVSMFTLVTMTYDSRLWNLKMYVKHYSRCASVKEIVVIWNKGPPPDLTDLDSAVPVRIRVEKRNSLNNRFKIDPLIKTRGILELDDDIMMSCDDIEKGFNVWRAHPDRLVGFYPRLVDQTLLYRGEQFARNRIGYNVILTGAAFMDAEMAFLRYNAEEARLGRDFVDKQFNCEDVLMNFLYANASGSHKAVEYVRPAWTIDTSKFSGVAISGDTDEHYRRRSKCLRRFSDMYGSLSDRKWNFGGRGDGWDL